jgi:class 3 adenylate cyclase
MIPSGPGRGAREPHDPGIHPFQAGGFAHGQALITDGDDYIGRPTNLASRLCQAAHPEELLAVGYPAAALPPWIKVLGLRSVTLSGLGRVRGAQRLGLVADLELPNLSQHYAAPRD